MKVLALNFNHDCGIVILDNGEITYYRLGERITRVKHDNKIDRLLGNLHEQQLTRKGIYDKVICSNFQHYTITNTDKIQYQEIIFPIADFMNFCDFEISLYSHHLYHAFSGFHNSGFDESVVITTDGGGSLFGKSLEGHSLQEHTCIFHIKYPNIILYEFKYLTDLGSVNNSEYEKLHVPFEYEISTERSFSNRFELKCLELNFSAYDAGKIMGLSQCIGYESEIEPKWRKYVKSCHQLQSESQEKMLELITKAVERIGCKNVVLSGGYALNCVANYHYLKHLPKDVNLYIDPIPNDSGISLGAAYYHYYERPFVKTNRRKLENVYLGHEEESYYLHGLNKEKVSYSDIVNLISEGNVVAMFQGKSEVGQRALGNRSLLFDPRRINGKDEVNVIKKRESFRPFGATILLEDVHEWFDMRGLDESPFMMYAVDAKDGVKEKVPAVIHYDNTCRIQTVTKRQNKHFYNLIKEFKSLSGVPILLNTSFNLAGEPLVETFKDAIDTLKNSQINYLYLPEISTLITLKENEPTTSKSDRNYSGSGRTIGQNITGSDFVYS
jgi:carbamoyltransferase